MKTSFAFVLVAAAVVGAAAAPVQAQVGVSIGINQPGVYGRINIGDVPQPALVYAQPVLIAPPPVAVNRQPIYLYVPESHTRDWRRYCDRYSACGQPVYFVQERWVRERYEHQHPGWERGQHRGDDEAHHGHGHGHGQKDKKDKHDKHGRGHDRND